MLVLAADTSLPLLSVALVQDGALVGALTAEGRGSRNEKLLPAIDWLLTESGIERTAIDLFAVTRGPGSFTGVRIGLATMQGLAVALRRPVFTMSTHEAIAYGLEGRLAVVDDAGRGELYVSIFENGREIEGPHLAAVIEEPRVVRVAEFLQEGNVALRCARLARELEQRGEGAGHRDVTPIYVRLAEAEVQLLKRNG
ncbi:MAG: tRNA (adenosine(37)-N6)-threonylcarbamoyltransferase complex dimerization subunit type 1 TsaB [Acidobacteriota bacterium]